MLVTLKMDDICDVVDHIKHLTEALRSLESDFFCKKDERHKIIEEFLKAPASTDFEYLIEKFNDGL